MAGAGLGIVFRYGGTSGVTDRRPGVQRPGT
jgi:uncharacterized membrane-anchored protein YitT (DUF2179 family)